MLHMEDWHLGMEMVRCRNSAIKRRLEFLHVRSLEGFTTSNTNEQHAVDLSNKHRQTHQVEAT